MTIEQLDLTHICDVRFGKTTVEIDKPRVPWLKLGSVDLQAHMLSADFVHGVVDYDYDAVRALRIPLIGVTWDFVSSNAVFFKAWIDPSSPEDFHVPPRGWDPRKDPSAWKDKKNDCLVVPSYLPPRNDELFKKFAGKQIRICIQAKTTEK
jgi:hypothetical protein